MRLRPLIIILMLAAFFSSAYFLYGYYTDQTTKIALPVLGEVHDFDLKGIDGRSVTFNDLRGKVWVADFMFTSCGGICPVMTKSMKTLERAYASASDVRLVSISVNPEMDTPQVLGLYAQKYDVNTDKWFFLTGTDEAIKRLAVESFKLGSIDEPVFHSSYFTLVDAQGRIRGYYDGTDAKAVQKILVDIAKLIEKG